MSRYWGGSIGAVNLLDGSDTAGFELDGAEAFEANYTGNSVVSASGARVHTQYEALGATRVLEIRFLHIPKTLLTSLLTELKALLPGGGSVSCTFTDGYQTINRSFKPNVPNWYKRGQPDGAYIKDAVITLIETGA